MKSYSSKASKCGLRACVIIALALALLILINLAVALLPQRATSFDISLDQKYSFSDNAKRTLSKLEEKVSISLLVYGGRSALSDESLYLQMFLERLCEYSKLITFEVVDTAKTPTAPAELGAEGAANLSVVVKSDARTRVIPIDSFFYFYINGIGKVTEDEANLYYSYYGDQIELSYLFDGENLLLNAISYATADYLPKIYALSGHNETALATDLISAFSNHNLDCVTLTLTESGVPSDCSMLVINLPTTDLSATENELLVAYMNNGGKLLLITAPDTSKKLPHLMALANAYALFAENGIVIEPSNGYYYQYPHYLIPSVGKHTLTNELAGVAQPMLPLAHSIRVGDSIPSGLIVTPIFTTSPEAYIVPTDATSLEKPEGQQAKTQNIGIVSEAANGSVLIWISSYGISDSTVNSYVSGGNYAYLASFATNLCEAQETINNAPISLSGNLLTPPALSVLLFGAVFILIIPLSVSTGGFIYWLRRRRK